MNLLDIARALATNIGEEMPETTQDDTPFSRLAVQFINDTGRDLIRRVDWHTLNRSHVLTGNGTGQLHNLPTDYMRLIRGQAVSHGGAALRGSLSSDEWASLTHTVGSPRYFRATARTIGFYPFLTSGAQAAVSYQSRNWAQSNTNDPRDSLSRDNDRSWLPGDLLAAGAVWRWFRHAGRDFSDYMAEYEQMLTDYAQAEGGMRQP